MKSPRHRLAQQDELGFDPHETTLEDTDTLQEFAEPLQKWWIDSFGQYADENNGFFTPPQREAIPHIEDGTNTLVASPTGSGKTMASFGSIIDKLTGLAQEDALENSVYCVYVSPLKSLANDIQKNLSDPLEGVMERMDDDSQEIRHAIRHGDTPKKERRKMLDTTPHILNTTPETLAILLNSRKFRKKFSTLQYIIVDEIHSLAGNKRGTHMSVSLERLVDQSTHEPTRIGCSATVEPLDTVGEFLCGYKNGSPRDFEIVDTRFVRESDIEIKTPVPDLITTPRKKISSAFYSRLNEVIQDHDTTLVFTNTRSGAESTLSRLRNEYDEYDADTSAAHHGSMSKEKREEVEDQLKDGDYRVVTSSTSLALGVDISSVDVVVQVGSPKTIAGLLQRIGRAGHQLGETVKGRVFVLNRDELVECTVMADRAADGYVDRVFIPERAHDVAAQQVYGMAINAVQPRSEVKQTLKRAYPYRNYSDAEFDKLMQYLRADYDGLEDQNVYPKVWCDENDPEDGEFHYDEYEVGRTLMGKRGKKAQMIYATNIGTIPDSFSISVKKRTNKSTMVGELDEEYLDTLEKGDVFVLGGSSYEYKYRRGSNVYVDNTGRSPTVPSWFSERLPLSFDLGKEILTFQDQISHLIQSGDISEVTTYLEQMPIDDNTVAAVTNLMLQQDAYLGDGGVSTPTHLTVEEHEEPDENNRHYYVHSVHGRQFNDGLSRVLAQQFADEKTTNVRIGVNDHGFALTVPIETELDVPGALRELEAADVESHLRRSLEGTDFLKRYFRINATRSLAILGYYKGRSKSARQQQVMSEMLMGASSEYDKFAPLEETYRELMENKLDQQRLEQFLAGIPDDRSVEMIPVDSPSPRGFSLATLSSTDVVLADDESTVLREFHEQVLEAVDEDKVVELT